jgi:hypothetical protein
MLVMIFLPQGLFVGLSQVARRWWGAFRQKS